MSPFEELAERRPRAWGAMLAALGVATLTFLRGTAETMGSVSIVLMLLCPFCLVFGIQALALGTPASQLRSDRATMGVLLALSALGSLGLWQWLVG